MSGFNLFLKIWHIAQGHVPPLISHLFSTSQFLALEKQFGCIHPIVIGEVTYRLIAHTLAIQFKDTFMEHFSPH